MYYIRVCIVLLLVDCGYIVVSLESITSKNFGCNNDGSLYETVVYRYSPISLTDIFKSEQIMNSVVELLSTEDTVRITGHGLFSPEYTFNGCFNLSEQYRHNETYVDKFPNQVNSSMHGCFRGCTQKLMTTQYVFVGLSYSTCYCIFTDDLDAGAFVDNKLCDESKPESSIKSDSKYIFSYSSDKNKEFNAVYKHEAHFQLCKYAVRSALWGIKELYSQCNLLVDAVVCAYSDTQNVDQNFKPITPRNSSNVRVLCDGEKNVNELEISDLDIYFKRYSKDLFMLRHYKDLFIRKSTYNGSDCISLKRVGDNLFVQREACNIHRKYVCKEVNFMPMMVKQGLYMFGLWCFICIIIGVVAFIYARKTTKRSPNESNAKKGGFNDGTDSTEDNAGQLSDGASDCFAMESIHDDGSVPGRSNQGGAVYGRLNRGGAVSGRINNVGAVSGRIKNDGNVSGRMNNGGAVFGLLANDGAVSGRLNGGDAVSGRLNNGGAISGRIGKWMAAMNIFRVFTDESDQVV